MNSPRPSVTSDFRAFSPDRDSDRKLDRKPALEPDRRPDRKLNRKPALEPGCAGRGRRALLRGIRLAVCGLLLWTAFPAVAQINTDRVMIIGRNALYFNDYILSIQYFNQVIAAKPYLAEPYMYRAIAKLSLEDYQGAEDDCTKALECNPFLVRAYYCRSYARMNLKRYEASVEDCRKGLEFDTENRSLMLNKAISRLYARQYDSARVDLDELSYKYPRYMYTYMSRGQLCLETGDTLGAVDDFSRAIAVDRFYAPAYAARGYIALLRESYADAIPDFNEAIRLEPDNEGYYINRGLARYYSHDYRGVLADFDRVLQLNPASVQTYYNRGLIRSEVGDDNRAIEDFDRVLELDPGNDLARYNRALLRQTTGDLKGAEEDLTYIIGQYPQFIPAYYQRSEVRKSRGNAKGSDKDYFDAWDLENKLREDRAAGRRFSARGDQADAAASDDGKTRTMDEQDIEKYNRVIVSATDLEQTTRYANPVRGNVQNLNVEIRPEPMFGLSFYEQGRPVGVRKPMSCQVYLDSLAGQGVDMYRLLVTNQEKALDSEQVTARFASVDAWSKQMQEHPDRAALYFARAVDFSLVKDYVNALSDLDQALSLDPGFVLACFARANLRFNKLLFELAEVQGLEQSEVTLPAAPVMPSDGPMLGSLPISEGTFGADYMLVMQDYDHLVQLAPDFVYAWYNRGNIRFMQKDYRSALEDYNQAVALSPDFAEAWFNRGIVRIYLGQREQGLRDLSRAGELGLYKAYNIIKRFSE